MNAEEKPLPDMLRADLIRKLKAFTLTYNQNQLLHKSHFSLLVHHVIHKRRVMTLALVAICVFCLFLGFRGAITLKVSLLWMMTAVLAGFWAYRRHLKVSSLRDAFSAYEETRLDGEARPLTLGDELRLHFLLSYDEHQAIHAGDHMLAADQIILRHRQQLTAIGLGAMSTSIALLRGYGIRAIPSVLVIQIGVIICIVYGYSIVRRVKAIRSRYSESSLSE